MNQGPLEMLRCLTSYFKEKTEVLLVANKDGKKELPRTPCIIVIDEHLFEVAVDRVMTIPELHCPLVALAYMFSMFYLMNIKYSKEAALTLEFIQSATTQLGEEKKSDPTFLKQNRCRPTVCQCAFGGRTPLSLS
ncbi:hypothetical protein SRHO_G00238310 [Serrasalmus rhombeus]